MKLKDCHTKTLCIPSSLNMSRPLMSTHITSIIFGHYNNDSHMKKTQCKWWFCDQSQFFFLFMFPSDRYVSSVAQHQNNKVSCGSWSWNYGKKDITALKAILLLSLFQCPLWCLRVCILQAKSTAKRRPDMGGGGHVCWQCWTDRVVMVLAHNSLLLITYELRK